MTDDPPVRDVGEMLESEKTGSGIRPGVVLALIALALFAVFIFQNTEDVEVTFIGFNQPVSLWLLSVIIFILGVIVGYAMKARRVRNKRRAAAAKVG